MTNDIQSASSVFPSTPACLVPSETRLLELKQTLGRFNQDHVLRYWNQLDESSRDAFASQLERLDLDQVARLYENYGEAKEIPLDASCFAEPAGFSLHDPEPRFTKSEAVAAGEALLRAGTIGVVIVAGGQGTRLGFAHPKGMFPIGPVSEATLFETLLCKVQAVARRFGKSIPVYLMTSPATHAETERFLETNERFGLSKDELSIFCQGTMPAVDLQTGKLLLANNHSLFESPDGHGGMLEGLLRNQAFEHMRERGVEHLFYMQIDNPLVDVAAADAIGYHTLANSEATTMVIRKGDPLEKVGNVAVLNGTTQIVEYSDLPEDVARLRRPDESLLLWAGNVAVHVWDVAFLEAMATSKGGLPFHYAKKKVPHLNAAGELISPAEPNAIKFERFIFDLLPAARRAIVVEVDRDQYFAPLKNPTGSLTDSPEAVQSQMLALHRSWLETAGVNVSPGTKVEIHPLFASTREELASRVEAGELGKVLKQDQVLR